jgi:hypothetical protein
MFQIVSNIYNRSVIATISIDEFLNEVRNPGLATKHQINKAREIYLNSPEKKNDTLYKSIKNSLPCITFLNTFNNYVSNENIVGYTGFMYIDVDNIDFIDLKEYSFVVAYWKSLSNNGYGILIKCNIDSIIELQDCVSELSSVLNIPLDKNAVSKDRLNIISYDENLYYNNKYTEYTFSNNKMVSNTYINTNLINRLQVIDTTYDEGNLRFSNLEELIKTYDFDGNPFIDLGDNKLQYAEVFIPKEIFDGNRNKSMYVLCSQIRGLNPWITEEYLLKVCSTINKDKFKPQLAFKELSDIVRKVFNKKEPVVMLNKTKRILFNPDYVLTKKEKQSMTATQIRGAEAEKNTKKIITCLNSWDFERLGKISQSKLAKETGFGIATIKRRAKKINHIFEILNKEYLQN